MNYCVEAKIKGKKFISFRQNKSDYLKTTIKHLKNYNGWVLIKSMAFIIS